MTTRTFTQTGAFVACHAAEKWLTDRGFSVGRMQGPDPRGILFGRFDIQKWRNLSDLERLVLDATMRGNMRTGPIWIDLRENATARAVEAFHREDAAPVRRET